MGEKTTIVATVKLKEPIQFGSETISELHFQKPKAKHFRALPEKPQMGDILNLAGKLAGRSPAEIDELGVEDMMEVLEVVGNFLPSGPGTSTKASGA